MKNGTCPTCNSATVYSKRNGMSYGDGGIHVQVSSEWASTALRGSIHYICSTCGYFESYITDKNKLEAVTKDWTKVG